MGADEDQSLYDVPASGLSALDHDDAMDDFPAILSLEAVFPSDVRRLKTLQHSDPTLRVVRNWVRDGRVPPKLELRTYDTLVRSYSSIFPQLKLDPRGILIRSCPNLQGEEEPKVCVPDEMIPEILLQAHAREGGHMGVAATVARIRRDFHFPRLQQMVEDFIHGCKTCQTRNRNPKA